VSDEESVQQLACEFRDDARALSVEMAAELHRSIPELGGDDPNVQDECRASCEGKELCSSFMFTYVDRVSDEVVDEYAAELEAALLLADRLGDEILAGEVTP
jgi:hypothetical protein